MRFSSDFRRRKKKFKKISGSLQKPTAAEAACFHAAIQHYTPA